MYRDEIIHCWKGWKWLHH